ncbi:neuroglobin [Latimeria chalumnae]|uniref:neuroglobin n=1 Tax=Latimeria chalumnae TaxID=7897 RepID=UPI00313C7380
MEKHNFSVRSKELIRESWDRLGKNKLPHGTVMFTRLFELDPDLMHLFNYNSSFPSQAGCLTSPEFIDHIHKVMMVVDAAVNSLDNLLSLEDYLINLGKKHQAAGVKMESFPVVGESLLYMLEHGLDSAFSVEVRHAWIALYSFVVETMARGWGANGENKLN